MDLLQEFPGTTFLEKYDENSNDYDYNLFSYGGGNRALDIVFEYCIGMCTYEEIIIRLEKELLFSQNHENSKEERHSEGLKELDCYYLCAFANHVEVFRETVLADHLFDYEVYEEPTLENCDLLDKIQLLHYYTLLNMRSAYKDHLIVAELFFSTLRDISFTYSKFMYSMQNIKNRFTKNQLKEISLYFWQTQASYQTLEAHKTQLIGRLLSHLTDQASDFAKEKGLDEENTRILMDNERIPLPDDVLFNYYNYPPNFSFHALDDSLFIKFTEMAKTVKT